MDKHWCDDGVKCGTSNPLVPFCTDLRREKTCEIKETMLEKWDVQTLSVFTCKNKTKRQNPTVIVCLVGLPGGLVAVAVVIVCLCGLFRVIFVCVCCSRSPGLGWNQYGSHSFTLFVFSLSFPASCFQRCQRQRNNGRQEVERMGIGRSHCVTHTQVCNITMLVSPRLPCNTPTTQGGLLRVSPRLLAFGLLALRL